MPASTPSPAQLLDQLSADSWFGSLPLAERRMALRAALPLRLNPGETAFRQGDAARNFYVLVRGAIKISTLRDDGKEAILAVLEAGNWFGEIALIDGLPRAHDATALSACELLIVPHTDFGALMRRPAFAHAIAVMLAARVRALYGLVEDATLRTTRARVARRLVLMAHGNAPQSHAAASVVKVSQESLAMMLGMTRQTLSKELQALVAAGAITLGYRCIEINAMRQLLAVGQAG